MPAFTFEKIPAPDPQTPAALPQPMSKASTVSKSRGVIFQMLDRIAVARLKRDQTLAPSASSRKPPD